MRFSALTILLMTALLAGCAHNREPAATPRTNSLAQSVGHRVTLIGIAEPRKLGAALRGNDFYVWIDKLHDWPTGYVDQRVKVSGVLELRNDLPVFIPKPGEPSRQGIPVPEGTDLHAASQRYVVKDATWSVLR